MLICVAREKSPIGSEAAMASVWYLPYGEKQAGATPLHLPVPQPEVFLVSAGRPARRARRPAEPEEPIMKPTELTGVVAEHISAVNALDTDAVVATFAPDGYVNDAHREFVGTEAIRRWVAKEMTGDK